MSHFQPLQEVPDAEAQACERMISQLDGDAGRAEASTVGLEDNKDVCKSYAVLGTLLTKQRL